MPGDEAVRRRVDALMDEGDEAYAIVHAGSDDDGSEYYLVVMRRRHEGNLYLNERYALLAPEGADIDDTFLKNGINRRARSIDGLADALSRGYRYISKLEESGSVDLDDASVIVYDGKETEASEAAGR